MKGSLNKTDVIFCVFTSGMSIFFDSQLFPFSLSFSLFSYNKTAQLNTEHDGSHTRALIPTLIAS